MKNILSIFVYTLFTIFLTFIFIQNSYARAKDINALKYFKHHKLKELYQVPQNPKYWTLLLNNISNNVRISDTHFINYKILVVAYGPALKLFMKSDKKYYPLLQSIASYGVKLAACHQTMLGMHVKKTQIFKFVHIVYPGAIFYIVQKENEGYAYLQP